MIGPQLRFLNALLAVRPDHQDEAQPLEYTSSAGERFRIFDGIIERVAPDIAGAYDGMNLQFTYGGPAGLRAISYIALTFFAHYFQHEARQPGVQPLKDFVTGTTENEFAWWLHGTVAEELPPNPFEFGHTVVLNTEASNGEASALISLFGGLHFGVALGHVPRAEDASVVVFIDPQCDHPPDDIRVIRGQDVSLAQRRPDPLQAHLMRMVEEGAAHNGFQELMSRIEGWRFRRDMAPVQQELNGLRVLPVWTRRRAIDEIVGAQPQRIFRLMRYVVQDYKPPEGDAALSSFLRETLNRMVEPDPTSASGLTDFAHAAAMLADSAVALELDRKLAREEVDLHYLRMLFSGGPGAAIVGEAMFGPLLAALGRLAAEQDAQAR